MKKNSFLAFVILIFLTVFLCGCGGTKASALLQNAAPTMGDLCWYTYGEVNDGTNSDSDAGTNNSKAGNFHVMCDPAMAQEFLDELSKVHIKEAVDWSHDKLTYPIYGLEVCNTEGSPIKLAWSNGYCITESGAVYTFDYDFEGFEGLASDYEWNGIYPFTGSSLLPCIGQMSKHENGWIKWLMEPAKELVAPEGISMVLTEQTTDSLTVEITNNRPEDWAFGTSYSVQVLLDDVWYTIPGDWAFNAIAIILPAKKTTTDSYDLKKYGELPAGKYRLVKEGMVAEFEITK